LCIVVGDKFNFLDRTVNHFIDGSVQLVQWLRIQKK